MRLTSTALLNSIAALAEFFSRAILSFILTPMLVQGLGAIIFGAWKVLERMVTYLYVADGRPTQGLQWIIANKHSQNNSTENQLAVRHAMGIWLGFLPLVILLGGILAWFIPAWVDIPTHASKEIRVASILLVAGFLCIGFGSIATAVLIGVNLGYKRIGATLATTLITGLLMALSLKYGFGLIGIAAANAAGSLAGALLFFWIARVNITWFRGLVPEFRGIGDFLRLNIWFASWTFINKVILNSDVVILGLLLSLGAVTEYSITSFSAQMLVTIIALIVGASVPGMGKMVNNGEISRVLIIRRELLNYVWFTCAVGGALIVGWNHAFITLWVGDDVYAGRLVDILVLILSFQVALIRSDAFIIDLTLDIKNKVMVGAISAALSIGLAIILIPTYGLVGLCVSMIIGRLPMTFLFSRIIQKKFGSTLQFSDTMRKFLTISTWLGATYVTSGMISVRNWGEWIIACFLTTSVSVLVCFFIMLNTKDRKIMLMRIRLIFMSGYKSG
ncbi:MAG: polysaccharide biosynthesis C-terminal domain-containing protein [Gammaproteobacteria bacterium]|nr:polysaccharide biosynthesis C-terminal domain-containing protein [Gammaproteobacteria bacterium]